jgi:F-type H+-transporting ATPase subunit b
MDETLRQLGGILLRAVPTFILVVLLHFYLKFIFFKPLSRILRQRYEATEGARKLAEASLAKAAEKAAEYEAALRAARAETYKELEQLRRQLQDDRAVGVREARNRAEAAISEAKATLADEVAELKKSLEAESDALADQIADKILRGRAA